VRSFSESWVKKEISLKLQAMQQDIIYLQRLKREAASAKLQAPSHKRHETATIKKYNKNERNK
jgi:CHASE3 domain sensor protein